MNDKVYLAQHSLLADMAERLRNATMHRVLSSLGERQMAATRTAVLAVVSAWVWGWQHYGAQPLLVADANVVATWSQVLFGASLGWYILLRACRSWRPWIDVAGMVANYIIIAILTKKAFLLLITLEAMLPFLSIISGLLYTRRWFKVSIAASLIVLLWSAPSGYWISRPAYLVYAITLTVGLPLMIGRIIDALREISLQALEALVAQNRFVGAMSHELRTPLNVIINSVGLLDRSVMSIDQQALLDQGAFSAQMLARRINSVLEVARYSSGTLTLSQEPIDLRALLHGLEGMHSPDAGRAGLKLTWQVDAAVPDRVRADQGSLEQALGNLVANAIKYTPHGGRVCVGIRADSSLRPDHVALVCSVADSGIGIPDEEKQRILGAFYQVSRGNARAHGGVGLGLFIVNRITERLGGELLVTDNEGGGTVFTWRVELPQVHTPSQAPLTLQTLLQEHRERISALHCLLIDDHPSNIFVMTRLLAAAGHSCEVVTEGHAALAALTSRGHDVVLLDLHMPGFSGWDVMTALGRIEGDVPPIIVISADSDSEVLARALRSGASAFIAKPVVAANLLDALERISAAAAAERVSLATRTPLQELRMLGQPIDVAHVLGHMHGCITRSATAIAEFRHRTDDAPTLLSGYLHSLKNELELIGPPFADEVARLDMLHTQLIRGQLAPGLMSPVLDDANRALAWIAHQPEYGLK